MEGNKKEEESKTPHILVVPYSAQGHINPMLQFSKRLVSKGLKVTLATTVFLSKTMKAKTGSITVETISDGFDEQGIMGTSCPEEYFQNFQTFGSQTLSKLIKKHESCGNIPISCVVYDPFLPWVLDVAKEFNLIGATFFTQACAVNNIYYHVHKGEVKVPVNAGEVVSIPGVPTVGVEDLPSFVTGLGRFPWMINVCKNQFSNIHKADWVFVNTFDTLEQEVVNWMGKLFPIRTVGPTLPSAYLDKRIEDDKEYGLNIFEPSKDVCKDWLNTKETASVIYVSFGSIAMAEAEQMEELAWALKESNNNFLWAVRESEENKLPNNFKNEISENGLVVRWCHQLEVLAHQAVGCFVTHCGWNSVLEALSLGVPMVGLPQWTDQPTDAKYIENVWRVGLRAKADESGIIRRKEIKACIKEIMEGEKRKEIKKNASKWKELAREAVDEGGSSDKNFEEFAATLIGN